MAMKDTVRNCFGQMTIHSIVTPPPPLQKREIIKETNALAQIQCYLNLFKYAFLLANKTRWYINGQNYADNHFILFLLQMLKE